MYTLEEESFLNSVNSFRVYIPIRVYVTFITLSSLRSSEIRFKVIVLYTV